MPAPVRTCVGCRGRSPVSDLVRLVVAGSSVVAVRGGRGGRPGRGASVHPRQACVEAALKTRAFGRALGRDVAVPQSGGAAAELAQSILSGNQMAAETGRTP
jgi:predicted RNA-binding protein YlxR (DUF448 family)